MENFNYNYTIEDPINLDDYEFEEYSDNDEIEITHKPEPSLLKYSTRTVNLSIFPVIDYKPRIDYIRETILPPLIIEFSLENIIFSDEILKKIILYRLIKDSIPYEIYFKLLCSKLDKEQLTDEIIFFKITNTQSRFIDIKFLYDNIPLHTDNVNTVMMRDQAVKTFIIVKSENMTDKRINEISQIVNKFQKYSSYISYDKISGINKDIDVYLHDLFKCPIKNIYNDDKTCKFCNNYCLTDNDDSDDDCSGCNEYKKWKRDMEIYNNLTSYVDNELLFTLKSLERITIFPFYNNVTRKFRNQVTFRLMTEDQKQIINVMIFQNGRMTFTGCRSNTDTLYIAEYITNLIKNLRISGKRAISDTYTDIYTDDIVNQSINCHYDLKFKLNNNLLYYLLQEEDEVFKHVSYKPNKFAGLKARFHEIPGLYKGTVCIFFQSGKINIYRSATEEEIMHVYETINKLMDKYYLKIKT